MLCRPGDLLDDKINAIFAYIRAFNISTNSKNEKSQFSGLGVFGYMGGGGVAAYIGIKGGHCCIGGR